MRIWGPAAAISVCRMSGAFALTITLLSAGELPNTCVSQYCSTALTAEMARALLMPDPHLPLRRYSLRLIDFRAALATGAAGGGETAVTSMRPMWISTSSRSARSARPDVAGPAQRWGSCLNGGSAAGPGRDVTGWRPERTWIGRVLRSRAGPLGWSADGPDRDRRATGGGRRCRFWRRGPAWPGPRPPSRRKAAS